MTFLHAGMLAAGLAAVSIPIIIHLLMRRRRKPVEWGAMRFLLEAYRRTRRRLLLERWLLLLARCLLVAAVAVAIGRPLLGALTGEPTGGRTVLFLVDNSLASSATGGDGQTALSRHIASAEAALDSLGDGDRAGLVLLGAPVDKLVVPPTANLAALRALLRDVTPTDSRADLPGAITAAAAGLGDGRAAAVVDERTFVLVLSDLTAGSADLDAPLPKLPAGVRLAGTRGPEAMPTNVTIRGAVPLRSLLLADQADQAQTVTLSLVRSGGGVQGAGATELGLRFEKPPGGSTPAGSGRASIQWAPGQREAVVTVAVEGGGAVSGGVAPRADARAAILSAWIAGDAIAGDNLRRVPLEVRETLRVGILGGPDGGRAGLARGTDPESLRASQWVALALRPRDDTAIEVADLDVRTLDASRLASLDAVFVTAPDRVGAGDWDRLRAFGEGGGLLVVMPAGDRTVHAWTDPMVQGLGLTWSIAREARTYDPADADRPRVVVPAEGAGPSGRGAAGTLLGALRAELGELARAVNVLRVLPLLQKPDGAVQELALSDGTGLVWAADLGGEGRPVPAGVRGEGDGGTAPAARERTGGRLVYIACSLDLKWTDLPVKPLMVALIQELVRQGSGGRNGSVAALAGQPLVAPAQSARLVAWDGATEALTAGAGGAVTIDEWGTPATPMRRAGVWDALDSAGGRRGVVAINADPQAGDLTVHEASALRTWLGSALRSGEVEWAAGAASAGPGEEGEPGGGTSIRALLSTRVAGRPAPAILLLAAVGLALVELLLARRASH